ncbi:MULTISPECIES: MerR family transcriptional regulator [Actinomadura]|uniref:MerR family transcriptional regulator n=1 Tax=Actinomadura yumaensis TaxID=111807 RepID=A0ABW2CZT5_9ACTN|nr:MerR family transcriptional regulator [Actinomadura sp. J1-007]
MMRIGEVARYAGVTPRALRYYEQQGLVRAARDRNGYRVYDPETVHLVRNVARLLRAGLSSEDVLSFGDCLRREHMDLGAGPECAPLLDVYAERLAMLDRRIEALAGLRDRLAAEMDRVRGRLGGPGAGAPAGQQAPSSPDRADFSDESTVSP